MPKIEFSILLVGLEGQRSIALSGTEVLIGRDDKCAVVLAAPSISRWHCRMFRHREDNDWLIEDLHSTNGTRVNGEPIAKPPRRLAIGDEITWGEQTGRLIAQPPAASDMEDTGMQARSSSVASAHAAEADVAFKYLLGMVCMFAAALRHEKAHRKDTEMRLSTAEAQCRRHRELEHQLREERASRGQAEHRHAETLKKLEELRQKMHTRTQQLDEANAGLRLLAAKLEIYERKNSR